MGYKIVRIRFQKNLAKTLQIMIEKADDSPANIEDCVNAHKQLLVLLHAHEAEISYNIEVSSTGINKPLTRITDLAKNLGSSISIITMNAVLNAKKNYGTIISVGQDSVKLKIKSSNDDIEIPFSNIREVILQFNNNNPIKPQKQKNDKLNNNKKRTA